MSGSHAHAVPRQDRRFSLRVLLRREHAATAPPPAEDAGATGVPPEAERLDPLPAPLPARVPLAGLSVPPSFRTARRPAPARPGALARLADGLRNMDGQGTPSADYRAARAFQETVPFRVVRDDEPADAPARVPHFLADWRELPHFRATCRVRGWCGLAVRPPDVLVHGGSRVTPAGGAL